MDRDLKKARMFLMSNAILALAAPLSLGMITLFNDGNSNSIQFALAVIFWVCLLACIVIPFFIRKVLGTYVKKAKIDSRLPGILSLSGGKQNIVLYAITVIGIAVIVTDIFWGYLPEVMIFPLISITLLSFLIHCIIDGKYYKIYKNIKEMTNDERI